MIKVNQKPQSVGVAILANCTEAIVASFESVGDGNAIGTGICQSGQRGDDDVLAIRDTTSRVDTRVVPVILASMKTAISLPNEVFNDAERLSRRKHMSRSELYATAIRLYVQKENGTGITEQLNRVYRGKPKLDPLPETAALADLPQEDW